MKTDYHTLSLTLDGEILVLALDRPAALNAFTVEMADELVDVFESASVDDSVAAIVVTGTGRAFCAGMDLSVPGNVFGLDETLNPTPEDMSRRLEDPDIVRGVRDTGGRVTLAIFACRKPVIAAINGAAVGIGATMTLAMDFRMAADTANIGFVFGRLGIVPEACSSWFLPRLVGLQQALEWVLSADMISASEAKDAGLLRSTHEVSSLVPEAIAFARKLTAGRSPVAVAIARQMLWRNSALSHPLEAHKVDSLAMFYTSLADGREGVAAFLAKRAPDFQGRASAIPCIFPDPPIG